MLATERKRTGSYYTGWEAARFLAAWAIRSPWDRILEPCFGEGVFLRSALEQSSEIGGLNSITGVDVDSEAWRKARAEFAGIQLSNRNFFELTPGQLGYFDVVLGNPPFIRYQQFAGDQRKLALKRAAESGVVLPALASAWAPFLVHVSCFLRPGGRLAMVAPFEITYARYARPVVEHLSRTFSEIHCLQFEEPLFPELSENTVLLLCDGYGGQCSSIGVHHIDSVASSLLPLSAANSSIKVDSWASGTSRARLFDLPASGHELYSHLVEHVDVLRLGQVANLTIGYVSGDNDFFHLTPQEIAAREIGSSDLRLTVRRGADLTRLGLTLTTDRMDEIARTGAHWLFLPGEPLSAAAATYVAYGESRGVSGRYKCRVRTPWYRVPGVRVPQMLLPVFSSAGPRIVVNRAAAVAANSILVVDPLPMLGIWPDVLAAASITSLAQLSAEIEGHALGGGALKLEPGEARRWALPTGLSPDSEALHRIDGYLSDGNIDLAVTIADQAFLHGGMGLDQDQIGALRACIARLRATRLKKPRESTPGDLPHGRIAS